MEIAKGQFYDAIPKSRNTSPGKDTDKYISIKPKTNESSCKELLTSINALRESVDFMLELFIEAAKELRVEERLDEIINQNKVIIDKLASLQNTAIFTEKQKSPEPSFNLQKPNFQPAPQPRFQQPHGFQQSFREPNPQELDELPELKELDQPPRPYQQGPVAMPSIPFQDFKEPPKPRGKGLFGRLKR